MSIPVDSINNRKSKNETETTVLGPFHTPSPKVNMGDKIANNVNGKKCIVSGKVEDINNNPIAKATIEIWQSSPDCLYHVQKEGHTVELRGTISSLEMVLIFCTVKPQYYLIPVDGPVGQVFNSLEKHPFKPAHIHFIVKAEEYKNLVTHVFIDGDKYLETDTVFAVKKV